MSDYVYVLVRRRAREPAPHGNPRVRYDPADHFHSATYLVHAQIQEWAKNANHVSRRTRERDRSACSPESGLVRARLSVRRAACVPSSIQYPHSYSCESPICAAAGWPDVLLQQQCVVAGGSGHGSGCSPRAFGLCHLGLELRRLAHLDELLPLLPAHIVDALLGKLLRLHHG